MKKAIALSGLAALALVATAPASAQSVKVGGDIQIWYNQVLDSNLRNNKELSSPYKYYNLRSEFKEDGFSIRRAEIKVSGDILEGLEYETMIDPSIKTDPSAEPMILQDAFINWKAFDGFALRAGQMKTLQTYEGNISSTELLFAERSQLGRVFGDKRDRGFYASYTTGDPKDFSAKVSAGFFNGMTDTTAKGKTTDVNAQKDFVLRADFVIDKLHKFGAYTLQGQSDLSGNTSSATRYASTFVGNTVTTDSTAQILDNADKTTNYGAYYVFQNDTWHFSAEAITGLLGRRYASINTTSAATAAARQYLDQKFFGYYLTGGYTLGKHSFLVRYDSMNYNQGDKYYGTTNPYIQTVNSSVCDFSPKYTETTLGYLYAWKPEKVKAANFKLNYIMRSKNFLQPRLTQTSEQGGNNIVAALQVAF